jgi:hypothetical protein
MKIKKYQMGGEMPAGAPAPGAAPVEAAPAPAPEQAGGDPLMEIAQLFAQGLQTGDCNLLAQGAEAFLMLLQQASAPAPMEAVPQGQPVFKKGGKLVGRKKCK